VEPVQPLPLVLVVEVEVEQVAALLQLVKSVKPQQEAPGNGPDGNGGGAAGNAGQELVPLQGWRRRRRDDVFEGAGGSSTLMVEAVEVELRQQQPLLPQDTGHAGLHGAGGGGDSPLAQASSSSPTPSRYHTRTANGNDGATTNGPKTVQ
jgi:hypothetical protein